MRKFWVSLVLGALGMVSLAAAIPQPPAGKKPAVRRNDQAIPEPACTVETIQLGVLKDGAALARTLTSVFGDFVVKPEGKKAITLYVVDRTAAKAPKDCMAKGWRSSRPHDELDQIVQLVDRDSFDGVDLNSNFLVHLSRLETQRIVESFRHPSTRVELEASAHYIVSVPMPGQGSGTGGDLVQQVAGIKHDLELLDAQANPMSPGQGFGSTDVEVESWFAQHTVKLVILEPRDVKLKLAASFPGMELLVWTREHAITILPSGILAATNEVFPNANAIERTVLYMREQQEKRWTAKQKRNANTNPNDPKPQSKGDSKEKGSSSDSSNNPSTKPPRKKSDSGSGNDSGASSRVTNDSNSDDDNSATTGTSTPQSGGNDAASGSPTEKAEEGWDTQQVVRLYHLRKATAMAAAINKAARQGETLITPIDEDLLLILPSPPEVRGAIQRAISILDLPRPKVSLQVWSYQISADMKGNGSGAASDVEKSYQEVKGAVDLANNVTTRALQAGLGAILSDMRVMRDSYFDLDFFEYLTGRFEDCVRKGFYCLGYETALLVPPADIAPDTDPIHIKDQREGTEGQPQRTKDQLRGVDHSLSRFLLLLAAANDMQVRKTINSMKKAMSESIIADAGRGVEKEPCASKQSNERKEPETGVQPCLDPLRFTEFSRQLEVFSRASNLHIVRAAVLDFLFHYKWANVYPNDFSPYDLQRSAHVLDSLLSPIVDAFNRDVDAYVQYTLKPFQKCRGKNCVASFGEVQVSTVSGNQASVVGDVKNYFDITPPVTLSDMLNTSSATSQALGTALKDVLEPKEITILSAVVNANSQPRITAEVSKNASLTITPTSLDTASSAELNLDFDVKEDTAPQAVNHTTAQQDLLDRIAEHHVTTRVRVDSLKLFQVSSFTMQLTHPQPPVCYWSPLCAAWRALFGSVPVVGHFFEIRRGPKTKDNRSIAIVRAVIVPTAMDLGLGLRFERDKIKDPVTNTLTPLYSGAQIGGSVSLFHQYLMKCMVEPSPNTRCLGQKRLSDFPDVIR